MRCITFSLIVLSLIVGIVGVIQLRVNQAALGMSVLYYILSWGLFVSGLATMKKTNG